LTAHNQNLLMSLSKDCDYDPLAELYRKKAQKGEGNKHQMPFTIGSE